MTTLSTVAALPVSVAHQSVGRALRSGALHVVGKLRRAFAASAQARAREQMLGLAARCETSQPQLACELRAACAALPSH